MAPLGPDVRVPDDLLEVRTMLLTRAEQWKQGWLEEGMQKGEATLLLRLLERRFGPVPEWAADRVRTAATGLLEVWGLRILEGGTINDVLAERPDA
jgi:hypothetical protein